MKKTRIPEPNSSPEELLEEQMREASLLVLANELWGQKAQLEQRRGLPALPGPGPLPDGHLAIEQGSPDEQGSTPTS